MSLRLNVEQRHHAGVLMRWNGFGIKLMQEHVRLTAKVLSGRKDLLGRWTVLSFLDEKRRRKGGQHCEQTESGEPVAVLDVE